MKMRRFTVFSCITLALLLSVTSVLAASEKFKGQICEIGPLPSTASHSKLKVGHKAPKFTLPAIKGDNVSLGQFLGRNNVVLSFVPGAFTPVCSEQWPGYNMIKDVFDRNETILLGITTDNTPSLFAWTEQMGGVWFPVLSDFWPHGKVSDKYGVLRTDGTSERALFIIDKTGVIRYIDIHDINRRPDLEILIKELEKLR